MKTYLRGPVRIVYGIDGGALVVHIELAETGERVSTLSVRDRSKIAAVVAELKAIMAELEEPVTAPAPVVVPAPEPVKVSAPPAPSTSLGVDGNRYAFVEKTDLGASVGSG